jgi:hypothetical protein
MIIRNARKTMRIAVFLPLLAFSAAGCQETRDQVSASVRESVTGTRFAPPVPQRADFVQASTPASTDYIPVAIVETKDRKPVRDAEGVKALQAELEASRQRHSAAAGSNAAARSRAMGQAPRAAVPPAQ